MMSKVKTMNMTNLGLASLLLLFGFSAMALGQDVNLPYVGTGDGASSSNLVLQSAPAGIIEVSKVHVT